MRASSPSNALARTAAALNVFRAFLGAHLGHTRKPWSRSMRSSAVDVICRAHCTHASSSRAASPSGAADADADDAAFA